MRHGHADRALLAMMGPPRSIVTTHDGTPYSVDEHGLVHVELAHQAELVERGFVLVSGAGQQIRGHMVHPEQGPDLPTADVVPFGGRPLTPSSRRRTLRPGDE